MHFRVKMGSQSQIQNYNVFEPISSIYPENLGLDLFFSDIGQHLKKEIFPKISLRT